MVPSTGALVVEVAASVETGSTVLARTVVNSSGAVSASAGVAIIAETVSVLGFALLPCVQPSPGTFC